MLRRMELGLLCWRDLLCLPWSAAFLGRLPLREATPCVLLPHAADVGQLLHELLALLIQCPLLQLLQLRLLLPGECTSFPCSHEAPSELLLLRAGALRLRRQVSECDDRIHKFLHTGLRPATVTTGRCSPQTVATTASSTA